MGVRRMPLACNRGAWAAAAMHTACCLLPAAAREYLAGLAHLRGLHLRLQGPCTLTRG